MIFRLFYCFDKKLIVKINMQNALNLIIYLYNLTISYSTHPV